MACTATTAQRLRSIIPRDPAAATCAQRVYSINQSTGQAQLKARVMLANLHMAALYVSFHLNSADDPSANGASVLYCPTTPRGLESLDLAAEVLGQLVLLGFNSRGLATICNPRDRGQYIPKKAKMPAIIVESAFLSNSVLAANESTTDEQQVNNPTVRAQMSVAIMTGVANHLGK
jgi:N-acetylmuramoyl-L-alanine amidase